MYFSGQTICLAFHLCCTLSAAAAAAVGIPIPPPCSNMNSITHNASQWLCNFTAAINWPCKFANFVCRNQFDNSSHLASVVDNQAWKKV